MKTMKSRNLTGLVLGAVFVAVLFLPTWGFCQPISDLYSPPELIEYFNRNPSWIPLPLPDSKYLPGSIIEVKYNGTQREVTWIDELKECYPPEALQIASGRVPTIRLTGNREFNANALLNIYGWQPGPEFSQVTKAC